MPRFRRLFVILLSLVFLVVVVGVAVILVTGRPMAFDSDKWKQGGERIRWRMAKSIESIRSKTLGVTPSEVEALLGKPDNVLDVKHPPPQRVFFYALDRPLDPLRWNLSFSIDRGIVTEVNISD